MAPFVGRPRQLAAIDAAISAAAEGTPSFVVVTGDAGIGKSSLVREALRVAPGRSLTGFADPVGGHAVPFGPWLDAFARERRPDLSDLFAAASTSREVSAAAVNHDWFDRVRAAARDDLAVVVLEDLHWADESSLSLLAHVARHAATERLVVIATLRNESWRSAVRTSISEVLRLETSQLVELGPLDDEDLRALVQSSSALSASSTPSSWTPTLAAHDVDRVMAAAGGNTFYAVELARAFPAAPRRLREIVLARVSELPADTRRAVSILALVGHEASHSFLAAAYSAVDDREMQAAVLDPALDQGLVRHLPAEPGAYDLAHALTRDVVRDSIGPGESARLSAAIAATAARMPHSRWMPSGEVADHWFRADAPREALASAVIAGRDAVRDVAPEQALLHFGRARSLWTAVEHPAVVGEVDESELVLLMAGALRWQGRLAEALDLLADALGPGLDPHRYAEVLERRGRFLYESGHSAEAMSAYVEASSRTAGMPPSRLAAQIEGAKASLLMLEGHHAAALEPARLAVSLARSIEAEQQEAYALMTLGTCLVVLGFVDEGMHDLRSAQAIATRSGDVEGLLRAETGLCIALDNQGFLVESRDAAERAAVLSRAHQLDGNLGISTEANLAEMRWSLGEWHDIDDQVERLEAIDGAAQYESFLIVVLAQVSVARGDDAGARRRLDRATALADRGQPARYVPLLLASAQRELWRRDPDTAWPSCEAALSAVEGVDDPTLVAWASAVALRTAADARARERPGARRSVWVDRSSSAVATFRSCAAEAAHTPQAAAWISTCQAEASRGVGRSDREGWHDACSAWERLSRPYEWSYCLLRHAEACLAEGEREEAARSVQEGLRLARTLKAAPLVEEFEVVARRARLPKTVTVVDPTAPSRWDLTARELDVLLDLCAGFSNKEIALHLRISIRTVGVHVSRVLRKMNVGTRTEAAISAHRAGLFAA